MEKKYTHGQFVIDGNYIIGGVRNATNYDYKEGVVIADFRPQTKHTTPSPEEQLNNAERIVDNWNEYDQLKEERDLLIDTLVAITSKLTFHGFTMRNNELFKVYTKAKELLNNLKK